MESAFSFEKRRLLNFIVRDAVDIIKNEFKNKMAKKIGLGLVALVALTVGVVGLSAFEAHVINVTAKIENALRVATTEIDFGTVFPQEQLEKPLAIALSDSFIDEDRVDDVEYVIRQKPKCAVTTVGGTELLDFPTATGHVNVDPVTGAVTIDCGPAPAGMPADANWGVLPSLCEYVSKHPDEDPKNDGSLNSFHAPYTVVQEQEDGPFGIRWNDTKGHLAKATDDLEDLWTIDLAVPCFGNHCAQDWEDFVRRVIGDPDFDDAAKYVQDINNEHKIFGCDLWIEVFGISLPGKIPCEKADLMLVLDRSGSIDSTELTTLKTAAKAFVDALAPSAAGVHMGEVSFSTSATLDVHLTDDGTAVKAAIDALVAGGLTNLEDALLDATAELANPGDGDDREDVGSPDFIVLVTDGAPTTSNTGGDHSANATAAATAAKAAGITIYVVGVGTTTATSDYLKASIATSAAHYFDAADFAALEAILKDLADCPIPG